MFRTSHSPGHPKFTPSTTMFFLLRPTTPGYSLGGLLAVFACEKALLGTPPERFIEEAHGW